MPKASKKLILASGSKARRTMLAMAGLSMSFLPANIDENKIMADLVAAGKAPQDIAMALAEAKAKNVAGRRPGEIAIGGDQVLVCDGRIYQKADTHEEARENLISLRGKTHHLISAVCLVGGKKVMWRTVDTAAMTMKKFSDDELDKYMEIAGEALLASVGCYQIEGPGMKLFKETDGDFHTILGMPLLPLLTHLVRQGLAP